MSSKQSDQQDWELPHLREAIQLPVSIRPMIMKLNPVKALLVFHPRSAQE